MTDEAEVDRLRRELRALAAVNRQLRAQLDGSSQRAIAPRESRTTGGPARARDPEGHGGFRSSVTGGGPGAVTVEEVEVVRAPSGVVHLREGGTVRRIGSNVVAAALEEVFGLRRPATAEELGRYSPGPTIEVYVSEAGRPFLAVAGRRLPLEGLPVLRDAPPTLEAALDPGPTVNVGKAVVSRKLYSRAMRGQHQLAWLQQHAGDPRAMVDRVRARLRP